MHGPCSMRSSTSSEGPFPQGAGAAEAYQATATPSNEPEYVSLLTRRPNVGVVRLQLFVQPEEDTPAACLHISVKYYPRGRQHNDKEDNSDDGREHIRLHFPRKWPGMCHRVTDLETE